MYKIILLATDYKKGSHADIYNLLSGVEMGDIVRD